MRRLRSFWVWCFVVLSTSALSYAAHPLFQHPAFNGRQIVFCYAGDLWIVDRNGGEARRLTTGVGIETDPVFSPDGSMIAFTGEYDGNTDVFLVPSEGGVPKRLTYHPGRDEAVGWTPDGKDVVFRSSRDSNSPRYTRLFKVSIDGGLPTALPLPMGFSGQFSPDGSQFAYTPVPGGSSFNYERYVAWGNYRGGLASYLWIVDLHTLDITRIPHERASDFNPLWAGKSIYFLSARNGPTTLYRYDLATKTVTEAIKSDGPSIRSASGGADGIVFDRFGEIFFFDPSTGATHPIPITVHADLSDVRDRIAKVDRDIQSFGISPTGLRAVFGAHGDVLTVPAKNEATTRDITNTPGVMERDPVWSPDGQSIAYFSDESGQYALHIASQTGEGAIKKFPLAADATFYFNPKWSPDAKQIAFHDNKLGLWVLDTTTGKPTLVARSIDSDSDFDAAWSGDSKWLAYTASIDNRLHALFLYSIATGKATQVSDGLSDVRYPAFDRDGQYLYFTASTNAGTATSGLDMSSDEFAETRSIYAMVLAADGTSPVAPPAEDEKTAAEKKAADEPNQQPDAAGKTGQNNAEKPPKPVRIDFDHLQDRVVALALPPAGYHDLAAGQAGILYFSESNPLRFAGDESSTLTRYDIKAKKAEKIAEHIADFDLSADGNKLLIKMEQKPPAMPTIEPPPPTFAIVPADVPMKPGDGLLDLSKMQVHVDPRAEWRQMYHEVWQIERSYFYDPHYHGVNPDESEAHYRPYLEELGSRADLNYLFQEMLSQFSIGHLRGFGGTIPHPDRIVGGLLGADYTIDHNCYRIAHIYSAGHWNPQLHAPLAAPGVKVAEGDYILAINGQPLSGSDNIQRLLEGTAGTQIVVRVASDANGANAHDITVTPIADDLGLRNAAWIEANRRKVEELSGGKLAYVYLPDTAEGGLTNFNRFYFAQLDKQGAVIDERFNSGGQAADYIINAMKRTLMSWWAPRYGAIFKTPSASILGPKVMITNEFAGSGGDAMPWYFREAKLGPLVGKRTWGGLVGIGAYPVLMDGGEVTSPSFGFFDPQGQWDVENHGVQPDYEVDMEPKPVSQGHDPQLEKAVSLALEELQAHPVPQPHKPLYPNYHEHPPQS